MVSVTNAIVTSAGASSLFSYFTNKLYGNMTDSVYNRRARVYKPAGIVSIVIPAFNEEDYIGTTLRSILSQNIILKHPDYFECIVVNNDSTDRTAEIAKQYCQVIYAPRGKLNARHTGIKHAVGDIIVSCDADCYYPPNWLNLVLRHFYDSEVVAVNAPYLLQGNMLHKVASVWRTSLLPHLNKKLNGASSAFRKEAYFKVGGFDLSINQFSAEEMMIEEEVVLAGKLRYIGKTIFELRAPCFTTWRSGGRKTVIEQRLSKSKYYQEVAKGERF